VAVSVVERSATVANRLGLHARPAAEFVKVAGKFDAEILVSKENVQVNGKSILGVMTLAAECGSTLVLQATGDDAEEAVDALVAMLGKDFAEEI
jgi:phosphocarrier protein